MRPELFLPSLLNPLIIFYKFPPVVFGGIIVAAVLAWFNVLAATLAAVIETAPYNFTTVNVSAFYVVQLLAVRPLV